MSKHSITASLNLEPETSENSVWADYVPIIEEGTTFKIYLTNGINIPHVYSKLCHLLDSAKPYHELHFYINNGGGDVDSAFMLISSMNQTKAKTIAHISGTVASAATIIALACDELEVSPFTSFMSHNYYHGVQGSGNQVKDYVDFTDRELKRAFKAIYTNFLTEEEIQLVTERDKEIWLNELEVVERWANYKKHKSKHQKLDQSLV